MKKIRSAENMETLCRDLSIKENRIAELKIWEREIRDKAIKECIEHIRMQEHVFNSSEAIIHPEQFSNSLTAFLSQVVKPEMDGEDGRSIKTQDNDQDNRL